MLLYNRRNNIAIRTIHGQIAQETSLKTSKGETEAVNRQKDRQHNSQMIKGQNDKQSSLL